MLVSPPPKQKRVGADTIHTDALESSLVMYHDLNMKFFQISKFFRLAGLLWDIRIAPQRWLHEPRQRHRYACFFGRPPLAPFARAAAALAGDVALPPAAPSCAAIQRFVP